MSGMTEAERGNSFVLVFTSLTGAFFTSTSGLIVAATAGALVNTGALLNTSGLTAGVALTSALRKAVLAGAAFLGLDLMGFMGFLEVQATRFRSSGRALPRRCAPRSDEGGGAMTADGHCVRSVAIQASQTRRIRPLFQAE